MKVLTFSKAVLMAVALVSASSALAQYNVTDPYGDTYTSTSAHYSRPQAQLMFVSSNQINVRSSAAALTNNLVGTLPLNTQVEIVDGNRIGAEEFIAVRVLASKGRIQQNAVYYVSAKHLSSTPRRVYLNPSSGAKTFVITNVATEMVRVYRRCEPGEGCVNKMIFESRGVNGQDEDTGDRRTDLGSFKITSWHKFYEVPGKYSGWYRDSYPPLPRKGDEGGWNTRLPGFENGRGAFGWFTAHIAPDANAQWFHGTRGWGADKRKYIDYQYSLKGRMAGVFGAMLRSRGCTRLDNESIAFMREILPVGTEYFKIYALESSRGRTDYPSQSQMGQFDYILTKNGAGKTNTDHERSTREIVLQNGTPENEYLEMGTLKYDQHPDAVPYRGKGSRKGDLYDVGQAAFTGVFLVDEGQILGYAHPSTNTIRVGGYKNSDGSSTFPAYMIAQ